VSEAIAYQAVIDPTKLIEIGQGAEGRVFEFLDNPGTVYKEYFTNSQNPPSLAALQRLVDLPSKWDDADREWINTRTTWPQTAVTDSGRLRGYLMNRIPAEFLYRYGLVNRPKQVICDWNFLSMRNRYQHNTRLVSEIPRPSIPQITELIIDLSKTLEVLHRREVVAGDISGRNIIWTDSLNWRTMLIDCDGFRVRGSTAANSSKQTPDWEDPQVAQLRTTRQSDIYKLGLASYRALWAATTDLPPRELSSSRIPDGAPSQIHSLICRSVAPAGRPSAEDWVQELAAVPPPAPAPAPHQSAPSRQVTLRSRQTRSRPVVVMKKHESKEPSE
jgi:hypothetical protein